MLTSSIELPEVSLRVGPTESSGLRQRRGKSAAASAAASAEDEEDEEHAPFLPPASTSAASAASVRPSASTSAASAGPLTASVRPAASAAPVGELISPDEPGLTAIIKENNTPVPNNVRFPSFTVGEGGRYGKAPPENLESNQIIEYNLLQKPEDQRKREYKFLEKQQLVLKYNLDKLVPEYNKELKKHLEPNFFTKYILRPILRPSIQDTMFYDDLVKEEIPRIKPYLHNLKTTIDRYKKLFEQVEANIFVHKAIQDGEKVIDVFRTMFGIKKGGKRTIRRKRSKPAKTYKKHGSYRRRHGKSQTRRS